MLNSLSFFLLEILLKPRAYRHFLFNLPFLLPRPGDSNESNNRAQSVQVVDEWMAVTKRFLALSFVDAYLRWFYLCSHASDEVASWSPSPRSHVLPGALRTDRTWSLPSLAQRGYWWTKRNFATSTDIDTMLQSYFAVWLGTIAETLALHVTITLFSAAFIRIVRRRRLQAKLKTRASRNALKPDMSIDSSSDDTADGCAEEASDTSERSAAGPIDSSPGDIDLVDLYRPQLVPDALLLSSVSILVLLSIVLLWESKLLSFSAVGEELRSQRWGERTLRPQHGSELARVHIGDVVPSNILSWLGVWPQRLLIAMSGEDSLFFSTDFAVRTLLGGLSFGVCLSVLHPRRPILTTGLLLAGWLAAFVVRTVWTGLPAHAGPIGDSFASKVGAPWLSAKETYCSALIRT